MLFNCWFSVHDTSPELNQYWIKISCLPGLKFLSLLLTLFIVGYSATNSQEAVSVYITSRPKQILHFGFVEHIHFCSRPGTCKVHEVN